MSRYPDARTMGRSRLAPYADNHEERASVRAKAARASEDWLRRSVQVAGGTLEVKNGGAHWILKWGSRRAEWWPWTAKLVLDQKWDCGIHAHDVQQVMRAAGIKPGDGGKP